MFNSFVEKMVSAVKKTIVNLRHRAIKWLAQDDLIIIGDIYHKPGGPALVQIIGDGMIVGDIQAWDGPSTIVSRGGNPKKEPFIAPIDFCLSDG